MVEFRDYENANPDQAGIKSLALGWLS